MGEGEPLEQVLIVKDSTGDQSLVETLVFVGLPEWGRVALRYSVKRNDLDEPAPAGVEGMETADTLFWVWLIFLGPP